jgi:thioredoxin-like negative regulator of GroEL
MKVIYFYAPSWYRTSNLYKYTFGNVVLKDEKTEFVALDVESEEGVKASIKYSVRNVPTIIILKNSKAVETIKVNAETNKELKKIIEKWK